MKNLIDLSKRITDLSIAGTAVVKSQRRGDPVVDGVSRTGIKYEGQMVPLELRQYIGMNDVYVGMWQSDGTVHVFVSPEEYEKI